MDSKQRIKLKLKQYFPRLVYSYLGFKHKYHSERIKILKNLNVDVVFDVGANVGLYAHAIRHNGFNGKIVSFEPQKDAFQQLEYFSNNDNNWIAVNYALGADNTNSEINISENSVSSSILDNSKNLDILCPEAKFTKKETIEIKRLDTVIDDFCNQNDKLFVKIDTQGYETEVINGSFGCLDRIMGFQLELTFIELYKNEKTFLDMIQFMNSIGYELVNIGEGWNDGKTGYAIQIDGIFAKKQILLIYFLSIKKIFVNLNS